MRAIGFIAVIVLMFLIPLSTQAEKIWEVSIPMKSANIIVDDVNFYLNDYSDSRFYIVDKSNFKIKGSFGKRGEGPGEFEGILGWQFCSDLICVISKRKVAFFNKQGALLEETLNKERMNFPGYINNKIFGRISKRSADGKRIGGFRLVPPGQQDHQDIYQFRPREYSKKTSTGKFDRFELSNEAICLSDCNNIIIGDPNRGFYFRILDKNGQLIREFNHPYELRRVTASDKNRIINEYANNQRNWAENVKRINRIFPKYYPPFEYFRVSNGLIYVNLYPHRTNRREVLVFDFEGTVVKKGTVSYAYDQLSTYWDGKRYYLRENEETERLELHVEEIELGESHDN